MQIICSDESSLCFYCKLYIVITFVIEQFRIVTAPFHYVSFADFWLADQLVSLTTVLLDLEYLICFYSVDVDWLGNSGLLMSVQRYVRSILHLSSLGYWKLLICNLFFLSSV